MNQQITALGSLYQGHRRPSVTGEDNALPCIVDAISNRPVQDVNHGKRGDSHPISLVDHFSAIVGHLIRGGMSASGRRTTLQRL